ncbi:MAG: glycosyltransferase family 4 protein [Clostridium sp.]
MKKKICHISTAHPTYDTRIYHKECRSLASNENEHDTYLIINGKSDEISDGVKIMALPEKNSRAYRMINKRKIALKKAIEVDADIYHFHDPELIPIGRKLKKLGKKVIYDVHEDVPKQVLTKEWLKCDFIRKTVSKTFNSYEKKSAKEFDAVICVSDDIANNFREKGIKNTVIVRNFPVLSDIDEIPKKDNNKETPVVIYAGGLTKIRGIKEIIEAIGLLKGTVKLWLLGVWESEEYKSECMKSDGWKHTKYFGSIPQKQVYGYMKSADIGIVNFLPMENHIKALPNKPFEYMACKLPMIMSNFDFWKDFFDGCFMPTDPENINEIAKNIEELLKDKALMEQMGQNGRKMVLDNYSWESESKELLNLYSNL